MWVRYQLLPAGWRRWAAPGRPPHPNGGCVVEGLPRNIKYITLHIFYTPEYTLLQTRFHLVTDQTIPHYRAFAHFLIWTICCLCWDPREGSVHYSRPPFPAVTQLRLTVSKSLTPNQAVVFLGMALDLWQIMPPSLWHVEDLLCLLLVFRMPGSCRTASFSG